MKPLLDDTNSLLGYTQTFLSGHPKIVQIGTDFIVIGGTVLTVVGGVKALITTINLMRIAQALAAGESIAGAAKVTFSLAGVRAMMSSLSQPIKIAVIATELVWVVGELRELMQLMADIEGQDQRINQSGQENLQRLQQMKAGGQPVPTSLYQTMATGVFGNLNREGTLQEQFQGGAGVFFKHFFQDWASDARPFYQRGPKAQQTLFQQRAPELKSPEVMAEFIKAVQGLKGWSEEAKQGLLNLTKQSFPESYNQGYAKFFAELNDQSTKTADSLGKLNAPLTLLPTQFQNAGGAAQRFSDRLDAIDLKTPTPATGTDQPKGPLSTLVAPTKTSFLHLMNPNTSVRPMAEFRPEVARAIVAESRQSNASATHNHHHHDNRTVNFYIESNNPDAIMRHVARGLEIEQERA